MAKKQTTSNGVPKKEIAQLAEPSVDYIKYGAWLVFGIAAFLNLKYSFTGIHNYLLENHAFRQTQTALSAYYIWKDGFKLAYETPVCGAPWSIPFEFPLYQWIVAEIKHITNGNMDYIGRIVSLVFFYLSLVYGFFITNKYVKNTSYSLILISFVLLHPTYIFWSRTFMIESTALFFCMMYLYHVIQYLETKKWFDIVLGIFGGVLAGLVKVTTLMPIMIFLFLIIVWKYYQENKLKIDIKKLIPYLVIGGTLFFIPLAVYQWWSIFTENLRCLNIYAEEFVSTKNLGDWFFGTFDQKISFDTWKNIATLSQLSQPLFYFSIIIFAIWVYISKLKYYKQALSCIGLYISVPLIFTNLHFIHDYYTYSNSFFLAAFVGFVVLSLIESKNFVYKIIGVVYSVTILSFFVGRYKDGYLKVQMSHPNYVINTCDLVKKNTKPDDVIMVYGNDWGSEYAYYSERRTIALRNTFTSVNDSMFKQVMLQNKDYNITTLVFMSYTGLFKNEFLNELVNYMGFKPVLEKEPFWVFQKENK